MTERTFLHFLCLLPFAKDKELAENIIEDDDQRRGNEHLGNAEVDAEEIHTEEHDELFNQQGGHAGGGKAEKFTEPLRIFAVKYPAPVEREGNDHRGDPGDDVDNGVLHRPGRIEHSGIEDEAHSPVDDGGDHSHDDVDNDLSVFYEQRFGVILQQPESFGYFFTHLYFSLLNSVCF